MASAFGHAAVALALGSALRPMAAVPARFWALGAACSIVPDLDVVGLWFGIGFGHPLGHRGLSHGLPFAVVLGAAVTALFFRDARWRGRRLALWLYFFLATASHGVLDALTNGGIGVAFFAPFDDTRHFFPWRPIEVSPLGVRRFLGERGLVVLASEARWLLPPCAVLVLIGLARRRARAA